MFGKDIKEKGDKEPFIVFVAMTCAPYEGCDVKGVYWNKKEAEEWADKDRPYRVIEAFQVKGKG